MMTSCRELSGLQIAAGFSATMSTLSVVFNSTVAIVDPILQALFAPTEKTSVVHRLRIHRVTACSRRCGPSLLAATPTSNAFDIYQVIASLSSDGRTFLRGHFSAAVSGSRGFGLRGRNGTN
jgi:hypothetical protein